MEKDLSLLKLMYLVSPALPIGAYAYSQGQEYAVDSQWLTSDTDIQSWISGVMHCSVASTDVAILFKLYQAWHQGNIADLQRWNDFLIASRETKELLLEDEQLGLALARVLETHHIDEHQNTAFSDLSYVTLFALVGVKWNIGVEKLAQGFLWAWLENQVAAATKLVPLGQTQAQKILMALIAEIPEVIVHAKGLQDTAIGSSLPSLSLSSCLHEQQYSRLFRS